MSTLTSSLSRAARPLSLVSAAGLFLAGTLGLAQGRPVQAQSTGLTLADLAARLSVDEGKLADLESDNARLVSQVLLLKTDTSRLNVQTHLLQAENLTLKADDTALTATARQLTAQIGLQASALNKLQIKTGSLTLNGTDLIISGVNVHIIDGTGLTASDSGLGNLTIGYNDAGNFYGDVRTGSHNLIVGSQNSYSSYGGIVAGRQNSILNGFATISGGFFNQATGFDSSVSGGHSNIAGGSESSVSGGIGNQATAPNASVSGGQYKTADQNNQWVGGTYSAF